MIRKEAEEYDMLLKRETEKAAAQFGFDESVGAYIVDHYVTVTPEEDRKGIVFQGEEPASGKPVQISLDLKKALAAGLEATASVNSLESVLHYIQLLLVTVFFMEKESEKELSRLEAEIVYFLHMKRAYRYGVEEEKFMEEVLEWLRSRDSDEISWKDVIDAINRLYEINVADFDNGNIFLQEKVWAK